MEFTKNFDGGVLILKEGYLKAESPQTVTSMVIHESRYISGIMIIKSAEIGRHLKRASTLQKHSVEVDALSS